MKPVGKPDAVVPPVRFDEGRLETEPRGELRYRHRRNPSMTVHSPRSPRQSATLHTKYRYKVLEGALRGRIRTIIRQVCKELGVQIVSGVLSRETICSWRSRRITVRDFVRRVKGRSSQRVQVELPDLRKRYWGRLGSGLLLHHQRQHYGRCHTSVSPEA
jgi:putative transposase